MQDPMLDQATIYNLRLRSSDNNHISLSPLTLRLSGHTKTATPLKTAEILHKELDAIAKTAQSASQWRRIFWRADAKSRPFLTRP